MRDIKLYFLILLLILLAVPMARASCGTLPSGLLGITISCQSANVINWNGQQQFSNTPFNAIAGNVYAYNSLAGTVISAWAESNSMIWTSNTAATNSIYFAFTGSNSLWGNVLAQYGEASSLSSTYGQYDNGRLIFPTFYDNFIGTTMNATLWSSYGTPAIAVNNGIKVTQTGFPGAHGIQSTSNSFNPQIQVLDMYGYFPTRSDTSYSDAMGFYGLNGGIPEYGISDNLATSKFALANCNGGSAVGVDFSISLASGNTLFSVWTSTTQSYGQASYGNIITNNAMFTASTHQRISMQGVFSGDSIYLKFVRIRVLPSGGTMPTVSFGMVESAITPTCGITASNTVVNFGTIGLGLNVATQNAIQLTNTGNTASNILIYGANWFGMTDVTKTYFVANTVWDADINTPWASATHMTSSFVDTLIAVAGGAANNIYLGSAVPNNNLLTPQNYNSIITAEFSC